MGCRVYTAALGETRKLLAYRTSREKQRAGAEGRNRAFIYTPRALGRKTLCLNDPINLPIRSYIVDNLVGLWLQVFEVFIVTVVNPAEGCLV